jgi:translation initiation factor IF-2
VPVIPTSARSHDGVPDLLQAISEVATGQICM